MDSTTCCFYLLNVSAESLRITGIKLEALDLLQLTESDDAHGANRVSEILLAPALAHEFRVRLDSKPLNLMLHNLKLEYSRTLEDLHLFSKASILLPLLPFLSANRTLLFTSDRLNTLWSKVAQHWDSQISHIFHLETAFFPDLASIIDLIPNLRLVLPEAPKTEAVPENLAPSAVGLFQISVDLAFLLKLSIVSKNTAYIQFKSPPGLSAESMGELVILYNQLIFLLAKQ
jgi:hypothetical protein